MKTVNGLIYLPLIASQDFLLLTLDQMKTPVFTFELKIKDFVSQGC